MALSHCMFGSLWHGIASCEDSSPSHAVAVSTSVSQMPRCKASPLLSTDTLVPLQAPPGPAPLPALGNLIDVGLGKALGVGPQPHVRLAELAEEHGDAMAVHMGSGEMPWVVLSSPEAVHEAFVTKGRDFSGRPMVPSMGISSGGGRGFASSELTPELQGLRRTAFSRLFAPAQVDRSAAAMRVEARALAQHLAAPGGGVRELRPALRHAVLNMVLMYTFSKRLPFSSESGSTAASSAGVAQLVETVDAIWTNLTETSTTFADLVVPPETSEQLGTYVYGPLKALVQQRNRLITALVAERRLQRKAAGRTRPEQPDMLDLMLDEGLSDDDILYTCVDMFLAGRMLPIHNASASGGWEVKRYRLADERRQLTIQQGRSSVDRRQLPAVSFGVGGEMAVLGASEDEAGDRPNRRS